MLTIRRTPEFAKWLDGLKDPIVRARLVRRLEKVAAGNLGDVAPIGEGVSEMREMFGAGWRMYFVRRGATIIMMLGGGSKRTQTKDIEAAKALAATIEEN